MRDEVREVPELERLLLRKSVGALVAGRETCADCRRTPLIGERVHVYEDGRAICELCRPLRRQEPVRTQTVMGSEHGHAVRMRISRAA